MTERPPTSPRPITLLAPAKVNLALSVGAPDASGMHAIASWMVAIDFGDTLVAEPDDSATDLTLRYADDAPRPEPIDWPLDRDLAFHAWRALEQAVGRSLPARITLDKRIPTGAGLGGGSSDAAATLVALDALHRLNQPTQALADIAATLGSDIPFLVHALRGTPAMLATGLGHTLTPAPLAQPVHLVLVLPDCKCPTGPVYAAFDQALANTNVAPPADEPRVRNLIDNQPLTTGHALFNDLAAPAAEVTPALRDAIAQTQQAAPDTPVQVSGSGSTLYLVAPSKTHAADLAAALRDAGLTAVPAASLTG
ncbi:MAG: hypothetical protein AAF823_05855 [Planctomycetota bacterium]